MYYILTLKKDQYPDIEAVASGAVLSTYQRTRVESVCERLGLQSMAFLWQVYIQSAPPPFKALHFVFQRKEKGWNFCPFFGLARMCMC